MFWVIDLDKYQLEFSECDCVADGGMVSKDLCRDDCTFMRWGNKLQKNQYFTVGVFIMIKRSDHFSDHIDHRDQQA